MRKAGWRLLLIVAFIPVMLPVMLVSTVCLLAAWAAWLVRGPDVRDGENRAERWGLNPFVLWLEKPADALMHKAGVFRELWAED